MQQDSMKETQSSGYYGTCIRFELFFLLKKSSNFMKENKKLDDLLPDHGLIKAYFTRRDESFSVSLKNGEQVKVTCRVFESISSTSEKEPFDNTLFCGGK